MRTHPSSEIPVNPGFAAGIIGLGRGGAGRGGAHSIGYLHAWAYAGHPAVNLIAGADRSAESRAAFAAEFPGVRLYDDYRTMLAKERPALVSICAYARDREPMAKAALEAGARLLWVEKPLAPDLPAGRRMLAEASVAGARLVVNHQRRYCEPFVRLHRLCAEGRLGSVRAVTLSQSWANLMDFGCHLVDAALPCFGGAEPVRVAGAGAPGGVTHHGLPVEDWALGDVHFSDGSRMLLTSGKSPSSCPLLRVDGSEGFAELHMQAPPGDASVLRYAVAEHAGVESPPLPDDIHHRIGDGLSNVRKALPDLLAALEDGRPTPLDGRHALRGLEIIIGTLASARLGRELRWPLSVDEFPLDGWEA